MEEYLPQHQQEVHKYSPYFDTSLSTNEEIQQRSCPHPFSYHKSHHPTPVSALDLSLPLNDNRPKQFLNNLFFHPLNIRHQPVPFMDNTFDYIQQDLVSLAYSEKDWEKVLSELVRVTKPGGYIQLIEMDFFTHGAGTKYNAWQDQLLRSNRNRHNINGRTALTLKEKLKNAGLTKIETKFVSIPIGSWGLDIGLLWKENYKSFMRAATPVLVELSEKPIDEFYKEWKEVFDELSEFRAFNNVHVAWGVKPN
ncbi:hypothetical protein BDF14DRAFT_1727998 [Spinellus fusiger]|nr:hypothetical protein BDF14DRAFT_1727998 [Spinellus fusiger]